MDFYVYIYLKIHIHVYITKRALFLDVFSEVMFTYLTKVKQDNRKAS